MDVGNALLNSDVLVVALSYDSVHDSSDELRPVLPILVPHR